MLREPYNLNPYNSTIDTSMVQPFSFVFSGDKLGAYQIQIAENNSTNNIVYTSPVITLNPPAYNDERVEVTLPDVVQTNVNKNDGRLYYIYSYSNPNTTLVGEITGGHVELGYKEDGVIVSSVTSTYFTIDDSNALLFLLNSGQGLSKEINYVAYYNASGIKVGEQAVTSSYSFVQYQIGINNSNTPFGDTPSYDDYRIQFKNINFSIDGESSIHTSDGYLYLNVTPEGMNAAESYFVDSDDIVTYYLYSSIAMASLQNLVGRDLVWRVVQWEELDQDDAPIIQNYMRNGSIIAKTEGSNSCTDLGLYNEVGVIVPLLESYSFSGGDKELGYVFYSPNAERDPPQPAPTSDYANYRLRAEIPPFNNVADNTLWNSLYQNYRAWTQMSAQVVKRTISGNTRWCIVIDPIMALNAPFAKTNTNYALRSWDAGTNVVTVDNITTSTSTVGFCCIANQYFGATYCQDTEVNETLLLLTPYNEYAQNLVENNTYLIDFYSRQTNYGIYTNNTFYSYTVLFTLYEATSNNTINLYFDDGTATPVEKYFHCEPYTVVKEVNGGTVSDKTIDITDNPFTTKGYWTALTANVTNYSIIKQTAGASFSYDPFISTRHCLLDETERCRAAYENSKWFLSIPVTYSFVNLVTHKAKLDFAVVDNIYFSVADVTLSTDETYYKVELTPLYNGVDKRTLIDGEFYGYELIMGVNQSIDEYDDIVTYTSYSLNTSLADSPFIPKFKIISYDTGQAATKVIEDSGSYHAYVYAQYSNGNVRGYIDGPIEAAFTIGSIYQLYSNFLFSNWYYFESRELPHIILKYISHDGNEEYLPGTDFQKRAITVFAQYSQANLIPLRYYQWIFYDENNNILDDSGPIYNSSLQYNLSPLTNNGTYKIKLITVSQNNVVVEKESSITTNLPVEPTLTTNVTVNSDEHYATVGWNSDLSAAPAQTSTYSGEFGNRIGVVNSQRDYRLDEGPLLYNDVSGGSFAIDQSSFVIRMGFVVQDNLEEYVQEALMQFGFVGNAPINVIKDGYNLSLGSQSTTLLDPTLGIGNAANDEAHRGQWLLWLEGETNTWTEGGNYWVETSSDTNVFYYELVISNDDNNNATASLYRTPFMRGSYDGGDVDENTVSIPYNNLLRNTTVKARFDATNGVETAATLSGDGYSTMLLGTASLPTYGTVEYVVYSAQPTPIWENEPLTSWAKTFSLENFSFNPKLYLYYTQISQAYVDTIAAPLGFGNKPSWDDWGNNNGAFIVLDFNDSLQSHRITSADTSIQNYEIYRIKYPSEKDAINKTRPIYNMYLGTVNTNAEGLNTAGQLIFVDYTIENNGWYRYNIVPTGLVYDKYMESAPIQTNWYGWSFTSIEKDNDHYSPIDRWIYYLNLETKGYSHVTNKVFHQGFNRYPKVSVGVTDYITSDMTGLLGQFSQVLANGMFYNSYFDDNIERIYKWENFINDGHMILVKDYKGRAYIAQLDGNAMNFQDVDKEILTTTSFNITQIDAAENYPIFEIRGEK